VSSAEWSLAQQAAFAACMRAFLDVDAACLTWLTASVAWLCPSVPLRGRGAVLALLLAAGPSVSSPALQSFSQPLGSRLLLNGSCPRQSQRCLRPRGLRRLWR
jgi:hypothetical protein